MAKIKHGIVFLKELKKEYNIEIRFSTGVPGITFVIFFLYLIMKALYLFKCSIRFISSAVYFIQGSLINKMVHCDSTLPGMKSLHEMSLP